MSFSIISGQAEKVTNKKTNIFSRIFKCSIDKCRTSVYNIGKRNECSQQLFAFVQKGEYKMYMVFLMVGIVVMCGLLCFSELIVQIWDKADARSRAARRPVYAAPARVPAKVTRLPVPGSLPDREAIGKICSLSDHFADHFQKVVNS